jgi:hypothetical protein
MPHGWFKMKFKICFLLLALAGACTKRTLTAQESLEDYLNMSFKDGQTRQAHLAKTSGVLQEQISQMSDEDFAEYINREALNKRRFKVVLTNCNPEKCFITYNLTYDEGTKSTPNSTVEVRKIAELWQEEGEWKVADVNNVKTHIQGRQEIEAPLEENN